MYILYKKKGLEAPGIDPGTSRMLSERSTIWATPPLVHLDCFWQNKPKYLSRTSTKRLLRNAKVTKLDQWCSGKNKYMRSCEVPV